LKDALSVRFDWRGGSYSYRNLAIFNPRFRAVGSRPALRLYFPKAIGAKNEPVLHITISVIRPAMQDLTPTKPVIPDFMPVPRKYRYDGWTEERQRAFIHALAETGSVKAAAKRINMSKEGAYYLRRQPGSESFAAAWRAALDHGVQILEDIAMERAIDGVEVPVFNFRGEQIGTRRWYNDKLLMFLLRHRLPWRFGPLKALPPGTKSPETLAAEAALAIEEEKKVSAEQLQQNLDWYKKYMRERSRLAQEAWDNGNEQDYDFYVRQMIMFQEKIRATGGGETLRRFALALAGHTQDAIDREIALYKERGVFARLAGKGREGG
jgi:hypothetical protein